MTIFADPSTFPSAFSTPAERSDAADVSTSYDAPDNPTAEPELTAAQRDEAAAPVASPAAPVTSPAAEAAGQLGSDGSDPADTPAVPVAADFAALGLPHQLVRALRREGITAPFEIQRVTVPDALAGRDVLGRGQTGSGKTLAFGLPLLARMADGPRARPRHPRALVLVPTRELAMQVNDALLPLGKAVGVFLKTAVGGVPYDRQIDALHRGVEIIVATPGRLGDLINRGACNLDDIEVTVLDEADQMADMGFLPDVTELLAKTPAGAQRLLFSATLDGDVDALVKRFMTDPVTHSTAPPTAAVSTMDHHMLLIPPTDKFAVTASIAARSGRTMMFARTQMGVDRLVEQLASVGVRAGALHGGKTQRVRTRTLAEFREGRMNVLVATDVAARGIHVDGVSLVVHIDPPKDPKDYLHRAGRTARAGESGAVATLVLPKQRRTTLAMLEKAGVEPAQTRVRPGDAALVELTGAREPSGVPVVDEPLPPRRAERPRTGERRFGDRFGDRDGRTGFGDRDGRTGGRRTFGGDRDDRRFGEGRFSDHRSGDRATGDHRPGDRPFGDRGDRTFSGRRFTGPPAGDRPSRGREDRPADRSFGGRRFGERDDRPAGAQRFGERDDRPAGARRFGERDDRPAGARRFGERGERSGAWRSDNQRDGFRPEGRRHDDRPTPERGQRHGEHRRDERTGRDQRSGHGDRPSYGDRPGAGEWGFDGRRASRTR